MFGFGKKNKQKRAEAKGAPVAAPESPAADAASEPPRRRSKVSPKIPTEWAALDVAAMAHCKALQEAHNARWGMNRAESWSCNLEQGFIKWVVGDTIASASVELLGTWNPSDQSFLWGWAHPSVPEERAAASNKLKSFAETYEIRELLHPRPRLGNQACWRLVAPVALVAGLQGVYRAEMKPGGSWAYFGFGGITLSKRED